MQQCQEGAQAVMSHRFAILPPWPPKVVMATSGQQLLAGNSAVRGQPSSDMTLLVRSGLCCRSLRFWIAKGQPDQVKR